MAELTVHLRPSPRLRLLLPVIHVAAGAAVWFSALPWWLCLGADGGVFVSLVRTWRQHPGAGHRTLHYGSDGWCLTDKHGPQSVRLVGEFLVTPWLLVLRFKGAAGRCISLVLPSDSAHPEELRRLRVLLRFGLGKVS